MKKLFILTFNTSILFLLSVSTIARANVASGCDTIFTVTIDAEQTAQTIDNFGASGCWFSEGIGKYWPAVKKEKIAQLLFSRQFDAQGSPLGIGLSAWRFNIGAGTTEQGDSSGIKDFRKRTESFLTKNGTYDWNKQSGYQFFLQKAHQYGVETLIAFSNSPPVQFTKNGLGYKTEADYISNLKDNDYEAYANFLAQVVKHFDKQGLHFQYISPVNEPQWKWSNKYMEADQEGSPWKNEEIFKITTALNKSLNTVHSNSRILITEAGMLDYLYSGKNSASHQIQSFFAPQSPYYLGNLNHIPKMIGGHSYFTEAKDSTLYATRNKLADTARKYKTDFWETEYSMLADGYKEGTKGKRSAMDCALFLAKVIHTDLTVADAKAWQFWNAYEPGNADFDTRYYFIALHPNPSFTDGEFTVTKNLWAMGSFSRFIRPGMQRLITQVTNTANASNSKLLISSYIAKNHKLVIVAINYGYTSSDINLDLKHFRKKYKNLKDYLTTADPDTNMRLSIKQAVESIIHLPARSISTITLD